MYKLKVEYKPIEWSKRWKTRTVYAHDQHDLIERIITWSTDGLVSCLRVHGAFEWWKDAESILVYYVLDDSGELTRCEDISWVKEWMHKHSDMLRAKMEEVQLG